MIYLFCLFFLFLSQYALAQNTLIDVALKARPAVVEVDAINLDVYKPANSRSVLDIKAGRLVATQKILTRHSQTTGAGVIIDSKGIIVTNLHTIYLAPHIVVKFSDGTQSKAQLLSVLPNGDLALLKISAPHPLNYIVLADSDKLNLGEEVINIGHSFLLKGTISQGRIIGLARISDPASSDTVEYIKININLYKGDSGGPVLNARGELIGMIQTKFLREDKKTLVIPSNKIKKLHEQALR